MRRLKFVLTVALVFIIAISTKMAFAPTADPDVVVPRLQNPVTLDGAIIGDEWSDAEMLSVAFYFYDIDGVFMDIARNGYIYLKHDCENLWICIVIDDPTENANSWGEVYYDVNGDGSTMTPGDDNKAVIHPNNPLDYAIITDPPGYNADTNLGGSNDIQGASGWASQTLTYEFTHPLNSGDSNGNDPALEPGDSILALFLVGDPEIPRSNYGWGGQYDLILVPCAVGGTIVQTNKMEILTPVLAYLTGMVAIASTTAIIYRRRKNQTS